MSPSAEPVERSKKIIELVYLAKALGATREEVVIVCRGSPVCYQTVEDAYGEPRPEPTALAERGR